MRLVRQAIPLGIQPMTLQNSHNLTSDRERRLLDFRGPARLVSATFRADVENSLGYRRRAEGKEEQTMIKHVFRVLLMEEYVATDTATFLELFLHLDIHAGMSVRQTSTEILTAQDALLLQFGKSAVQLVAVGDGRPLRLCIQVPFNCLLDPRLNQPLAK